MNLPTFGQLLAEYMQRSGINDSELARSIGVRRQTIFRWKEGLVERPRAREDVLQCAKKLRLTEEERNLLLLTAGFAPEQLTVAVRDEAAVSAVSALPQTEAVADNFPADAEVASVMAAATVPTAAPVVALNETAQGNRPMTVAASPLPSPTLPPTVITAAPESSATLPPWLERIRPLVTDHWLHWWPMGAGLLIMLLLGLLWTRRAPLLIVVTPTPLPPATVELHAPPQTTPINLGAYPVAAAGETLLLVAQFKDYTLDTPYNVAGRISEELGQQIAAAGLVSITVQHWPEEITTALRARQLLTATNATLVIWGEYDSGRVRVNLDARDPKANQSRNFTLTPADELVTTINAVVPVEIRNTALLALGSLANDQGHTQMTVGRLLRDQGNYQAAATLFERALELNPPDSATAANLHFYLGYLAEKSAGLADYDRAITYYTRAFALNPQLVTALYNRGTAQIARIRLLPANEPLILEGLNAAIDDLTLVIAQRPGDSNAYLNRAIAYYERDYPNDMTAALADLTHVIAVQPANANAYFNRGLVHLRGGKAMAWLDDFQKTLALDPKHTGAISGLCWGYALVQQAAKALPYCNQAVMVDPTGLSNDSRGIVYAQLGRYPEAIADFHIYLDSLQREQAVTLYERYRGPLVEEWITQLEAGKTPFDSTLLEKLRHRDHY